MIATGRQSTIGLLLSGGLDSSILLVHLLKCGQRVQPLYVRSGLVWERDELLALRRFLRAVDAPGLQPLVVLELPLDELYGGHWSLTGVGVPSADTEDDAVYLPGRNPLLLIKAMLWCRVQGIEHLALALLGSNPFADATPEFFHTFEAAMELASGGRVEVLRPFARMSKPQVMQRGAGFPLELTFSCIAPLNGQHCGRCNKCGERQASFAATGMADLTPYAAASAVPC